MRATSSLPLTAPGTPEFLAEECVGENNSVTATWMPHPTSRVAGYVLEIDDGDGDFKVRDWGGGI